MSCLSVEHECESEVAASRFDYAIEPVGVYQVSSDDFYEEVREDSC